MPQNVHTPPLIAGKHSDSTADHRFFWTFTIKSTQSHLSLGIFESTEHWNVHKHFIIPQQLQQWLGSEDPFQSTESSAHIANIYRCFKGCRLCFPQVVFLLSSLSDFSANLCVLLNILHRLFLCNCAGYPKWVFKTCFDLRNMHTLANVVSHARYGAVCCVCVVVGGKRGHILWTSNF